jgi:hypothetical protein
LWLEQFDTVARNLASGYARGYVYYTSRTCDVGRANKCLSRFTDCLNLLIDGGRTLKADDINALATEPDYRFDADGEDCRVLIDALDQWLLTFKPQTDSMSKATVWASVWTDIESGAQAQAVQWLANATARFPDGKTPPSRIGENLVRLGADRGAWAALVDWLENPARAAYRDAWNNFDSTRASTSAKPSTSGGPDAQPLVGLLPRLATGRPTSPPRNDDDLRALAQVLAPDTDKKRCPSITVLIDRAVLRLEKALRRGDQEAGGGVYKSVADASWSLWVEVARFAGGQGSVEHVRKAMDTLQRCDPAFSKRKPCRDFVPASPQSAN